VGWIAGGNVGSNVGGKVWGKANGGGNVVSAARCPIGTDVVAAGSVAARLVAGAPKGATAGVVANDAGAVVI
jgi:hypothetical protein